MDAASTQVEVAPPSKVKCGMWKGWMNLSMTYVTSLEQHVLELKDAHYKPRINILFYILYDGFLFVFLPKDQ